MFQNQLQVQPLFELTVTDDEDNLGTDDVTVEAVKIPQDESNSKAQSN